MWILKWYTCNKVSVIFHNFENWMSYPKSVHRKLARVGGKGLTRFQREKVIASEGCQKMVWVFNDLMSENITLKFFWLGWGWRNISTSPFIHATELPRSCFLSGGIIFTKFSTILNNYIDPCRKFFYISQGIHIGILFIPRNCWISIL